MPTVPTYDGPRIQDRALGRVRVNDSMPLEAFGGGRQVQELIQAAGGAISQTQDAYTKVRSEANDARATEAKNALEQYENDELLNPETGALNSKGKSAFDRGKAARERYQQRMQEIEDTLDNDDQKMRFREYAGSRFVDFDRKLLIHENDEGRRYADEQSSLFVQNQQNVAVQNYNNPERFTEAMARQEAELEKIRDRNGHSPEWYEKTLRDVRTKTHAGVIERLLNDNRDTEAQAWFERNQDQLDEGAKTDLLKTLEVGRLRGEATRRSDEIFNRNRNNMAGALEEARQIEDPKLRDETTDRIRQNFALSEAAKRDRIENLHRQATDIIEAQGSVDKIPPGIWKQFSLSERNQLQSYARAKAEGRDIETDMVTYYDLRTMAAQPERASKFKTLNLLQYRTKLGNTEFKELVNLQTKMREGDADAENSLRGIRSKRQIVTDALEAAGFRTGNKASKGDKEAEALMFTRAEEVQKQMRQQLGRDLDNTEFQQVVDNLMVEGVTKRGLIFDTKKRLFQVEPAEQVEIEVDDIPQAERNRIEAALKKKGLPVNDTSIVELYSRRLESLRRKQ